MRNWSTSRLHIIWLWIKTELSAALSKTWQSYKCSWLPRCNQSAWARCVCVGLQHSRPRPAEPQPMLNATASHSPSRFEVDQQRLRTAQAGRWTSGALRSPLPVRRNASGPQPSGVNLSDCQAKYCKRLAITQTVKGHTQFPELFTQLDAPPPPQLPRIGWIKLVERGKAFKYPLPSCGCNSFRKQLMSAKHAAMQNIKKMKIYSQTHL